MRIVMTADFEADEIEPFLKFIDFHSKRLKCTSEKVFIELAKEFERQQKEGLLGIESGNNTARKSKAKAATGETEA